MTTRYQFVDDSGETRLAGTLDPDPGGSSSAVVASASLNSGTLNSGDDIPFTSAEFDTGGYFSAPAKGFVIPAGKAGAYLIGGIIDITGTDAATLAGVEIHDSGAGANLDIAMGRARAGVASTRWAASPSYVVEAAVGDTFTMNVSTDELTFAVVGVVFWLVYLGAT